MYKVVEVEIDKLEVLEDFYPRVSTNWMTTVQYAEAIKRGDVFPPILVGLLDGDGKMYLVDGLHRVLAYKHLKFVKVSAIVKKYKDVKELFLDAIKQNIKHGKQLVPRDRAKIIARLEDLGFTLDQISDILRMPIETVEKLRARRVFRPNGTEVILKKPMADAVLREKEKGKKVTKEKKETVIDIPSEQEQANVAGMGFKEMIKGLIEVLRHVQTLTDEEKALLMELRHLIDEKLGL